VGAKDFFSDRVGGHGERKEKGTGREWGLVWCGRVGV